MIGNSLGCEVLVELALVHPQRVDRLVLQGPTPDALVAGFTRGFAWGAAILTVAAIIWVVLVNMSKKDMAANDSPAAHVG